MATESKPVTEESKARASSFMASLCVFSQDIQKADGYLLELLAYAAFREEPIKEELMS